MKYIREFEGLRGLMALWVVLGHWSTTAAIPIAIGKTKLFNGYAVDVFVILSGFAITALIAKRPERYGMYIKRRFLRIFPVYLLFLALSVMAAPFALDMWSHSPGGYMQWNRIQIAKDSLDYFPYHLAAHVTALQGIVPPRILPNTDYAFLGQAWSISLEWQFYLIAPFLLARLRQPFSARTIATIVVLTAATVVASRLMPVGFLGRHLHNFLIGIGSFYLLAARFDGVARWQFPVAPVWLAIILFCLFSFTPQSLPYAIWATVMAVVIASREEGGPLATGLSAFLNGRIIQTIGHMAYSIYLSHMLVILLSLYVLQRLGIAPGLEHSVLLLAMLFPGTLLVSTITYHLVEKPFHNIGRSLQDKAAARPAKA